MWDSAVYHELDMSYWYRLLDVPMRTVSIIHYWIQWEAQLSLHKEVGSTHLFLLYIYSMNLIHSSPNRTYSLPFNNTNALHPTTKVPQYKTCRHFRKYFLEY